MNRGQPKSQRSHSETSVPSSAKAIVEALACGRSGCLCIATAKRGHGNTHCPAHDDRKPSLSVSDENGRVLFHCHAGCEWRSVIDALRERGLWPEQPVSVGDGQDSGPARIVATYVYRDEDGTPLFDVCRTADKRFWQRRPGANEWGIKGVRRVLYRLPELLASDPGAPVFICEGEKDADRLASLGLIATTNPGGAGNWIEGYSETLRDRKAITLPDNDEPGQKHTRKVTADLYGVAREVRILALPGLPDKGDVSDWLDAGGTAEELLRLAEAAPLWEPSEGASWERSEVASPSRPVLLRLADVQREEVDWLWRDRLPLGKLTIIMGDPEVGKGWLSLAIAAAVTTGAPLLGDSERQAPANVLILTAEDGLGDTVRPRAEDMGADLTRINVLTGVLDHQGSERHLSLVDDLPAVEEALKGGGHRYFIIDPLNAYLGANLDTNRDAAMRSVLTPLAALAERHHVAIACILHLTKGSRDRAIYRGQGNIAYIAAARVVLLVGKNPDNEQERVVVCVKNNLVPHPPSLAFEISDGRFLWRGETSVTAVALLAPEKGDGERSALDDADGFLRELLADGPVPAEEIKSEAKDAGISSSTLKRAKAALGVRANREGEAGKRGGGKWFWRLPDDLEGQEYQVEDLAPLMSRESEDGQTGGGVGRLNPDKQPCPDRPPGEVEALWGLHALTSGDDVRVCACCGGPAVGAQVSDDGRCPTCYADQPVPERGGHLVRHALDLGGTLVEDAAS